MHDSRLDYEEDLEIEEENEDIPVCTHDFGKIKINEEVIHIFTLVNSGNDNLVIRKITTSCECTQGKTSTHDIPPGESYLVTVTFRDTVVGEFLRSATIYFANDKPAIHLELTGEIIK